MNVQATAPPSTTDAPVAAAPVATGDFAALLDRAATGRAGPTNGTAPSAQRAAPARTTLGGMLGARLVSTVAPTAAPGAAASAFAAAAAPIATASGVAAPETVDGRIQALGALHVPVAGRVTSGFGMRVHPVTGEYRHHAGVDVAAPTGTPVGAVAAGRVVRAEEAGGYGLLVEVDHGNGITSRYAHLSSFDVAVGDTVGPGSPLGGIGSTGRSTGPHLHLELRVDDTAVDPGWLVD